MAFVSAIVLAVLADRLRMPTFGGVRASKR